MALIRDWCLGLRVSTTSAYRVTACGFGTVENVVGRDGVGGKLVSYKSRIRESHQDKLLQSVLIAQIRDTVGGQGPRFSDECRRIDPYNGRW